MQKLVDEIAVIPGVAGSCVFDKTKGMVCKKNDGSLLDKLTDNIGFNFIRLLQMAGMNNLDVKSAQFKFDRFWLIGTRLSEGVILLAICDLQANCSLVASTAQMLAEDMRREVEKDTGGKPGTVSSAGGAKDQDDLPAGTGDNLQKPLADIENALAAAIGPVAKMIISDYISRWRQRGPVTSERLPELLDLLAEEIEDPSLVKDFRNQLKHLLA